MRHRFLEVNGNRLHVAEAGETSSPPLLLLHGFPQHWYMWRGLLGPLARTRHVIALDLRGSGWSDAPRSRYSTAERVSDVLGVLDALGIERVDLVGHDWGGWLGFRIAIDHPQRVARLAVISMVHPWVMQRHLLPNLWRWWTTALVEVPGLGDWMLRRRPGVTGWLLARDSARPEVWTPSLRRIYTDRAAEPARAAAARRLHDQLILGDIPRMLAGRDRHRVLEAPTLIVGGENDALLPPAVLTPPARSAERIRVRTVEGGHFLVDENPDELLRLLDEHWR